MKNEAPAPRPRPLREAKPPLLLPEDEAMEGTATQGSVVQWGKMKNTRLREGYAGQNALPRLQVGDAA